MKRRTFLGLILALVIAGPSFAVEQVNLSSPVTISSYKIVMLKLDIREQTITIILHNVDANKDEIFLYTGATALTMMNQLNKANLTTNSLQKRIFERLIADGKLVGTISGTPD